MSTSFRFAAAACLCATLGGCGIDRPGTWRASGSNESNLRAMVVDPAHLTRGVGNPASRGTTAAQAVIRLDEDRRRPLPDSRASQVGALATQLPGGAVGRGAAGGGGEGGLGGGSPGAN